MGTLIFLIVVGLTQTPYVGPMLVLVFPGQVIERVNAGVVSGEAGGYLKHR